MEIGLWEVEAEIRCEQLKKISKKNFQRGYFTPFTRKSFQIGDHFFSLLFPKDSKNLKSLDIGLWEVGAKRLLNGVRKCDRQTHTQTNRQTYGHFDL